MEDTDLQDLLDTLDEDHMSKLTRDDIFKHEKEA